MPPDRLAPRFALLGHPVAHSASPAMHAAALAAGAAAAFDPRAPDAVKAFLLAHRDELSPLSFREASRQLVKLGKMKA